MALPGDCGPNAFAEWPGAVSGKFCDAITGRPLLRRMVDHEAKNGAATGIAQQGFGRYFSDVQGLAHIQGQRSVPERVSEAYEWRQSRRALPEPGALHDERPAGKRMVVEPQRKAYEPRGKLCIPQVSSKAEITDRPSGPRIVVRENGLRALDQPAREIDVSVEMQRKARPLDLESQRNGIQVVSLGDKPYRHPDYEKGFHQMGGLIPGCGFVRGTFKKTEPRNSTTVQLVMVEGKKNAKSYDEKQRELEAADAQMEVAELTKNWETVTLRECDAKYAPPPDTDDEAEAEAEAVAPVVEKSAASKSKI